MQNEGVDVVANAMAVMQCSEEEAVRRLFAADFNLAAALVTLNSEQQGNQQQQQQQEQQQVPPNNNSNNNNANRVNGVVSAPTSVAAPPPRPPSSSKHAPPKRKEDEEAKKTKHEEKEPVDAITIPFLEEGKTPMQRLDDCYEDIMKSAGNSREYLNGVRVVRQGPIADVSKLLLEQEGRHITAAKVAQWRHCMWSTPQRSSALVSLMGTSLESPSLVWLEALEMYYRTGIANELRKLSPDFQRLFARPPIEGIQAQSRARTRGSANRSSDANKTQMLVHFHASCERIEKCMSSEISLSPCLSHVLRLLPHVFVVLTLANRFNDLAITPRSTKSDDDVVFALMARYNVEEWFDICIALFIASLFQSSVHAQCGMTAEEVPATLLPADELVRSQQKLKGFVLYQIKERPALQFMTLRYVKSNCYDLIRGYKRRMAREAETNARAEARTCEEVLALPTNAFLMNELPDFIELNAGVKPQQHDADRQDQDLTRGLILQFLQLDHEHELGEEEEGKAGAEEAAANGRGNKGFLTTVLVRMIKHMLLRLVAAPDGTTADSADGAGATTAAEGSGGHDRQLKGEEAVKEPSKEGLLQQMPLGHQEALKAICAVARKLTTFTINPADPIMGYEKLNVGEQPTEKKSVGADAIAEALEGVLQEIQPPIHEGDKRTVEQENEDNETICAHLVQLEMVLSVLFDMLSKIPNGATIYEMVTNTWVRYIKSIAPRGSKLLPLIEAIHAYMLRAEKLEKVDKKAAADAFVLTTPAQLYAAIHVVFHLRDATDSIAEDLYLDSVQRRLLFVRNIIDKNSAHLKVDCELAIARHWVSLPGYDAFTPLISRIEALCKDVKEVRTSDAAGGLKLWSYKLSCQNWDISEQVDAATAQELCEATTSTTTLGDVPAADARLPVPAAVADAMRSVREGVVSGSGRDAGSTKGNRGQAGGERGDNLIWSREMQYCYFRMTYPKCKTTEIVIQGTLLQCQLLLAIAQYGRAGVPLSVLAGRADMEVDQLKKSLLLFKKTTLICYTGSEDSTVTLNYDLEALPKKVMMPLNVIGKCSYMTSSDADRKQSEANKRLSFLLETTIVKFMKSERTMRHKTLSHKVEDNIQKQQRGFKYTIRMFKKAIDSLIQKNFMERDANDRDTYIYKS